jgi:hypothetical protein
MIDQTKSGCTVVTGTHINLFSMLSQRGALRLEIMGLKMSRGISVYAIVKKQHGFTGNKQKVLEQLEAKIEQFKAEHPASEK